MELDKVLAQYDFRGPEWSWETRCCYGHPHAWGYIVETVCGEVLAIGHACGETWIEGLDTASKRIERAKAYRGARLAIVRIIEELPVVLPTQMNADDLLAFRRAFGHSFPKVAKAAREDVEPRFYGTGLWRGSSPDFAALHRRLAALKSEHQSLHPKAPTREVKALQTRFVALETEARDARRWFDAATPFLTSDNLKSVIDLFGIPATVTETKEREPVITMKEPRERPMQFSFRRCGLKEKDA
jgi:hypothetical protein